MFAFLLISGVRAARFTPAESSDPRLAELPEPFTAAAPDSEVILDHDYGTELVLPGGAAGCVLALQEARRTNRPLRGFSGAAGHITLVMAVTDTLPVARFYLYAEKAYYIAPQKIEQLLAFFEEPPREPVEIEGLVLVSDLDDSIILDLKYATADNFTGEQVYPVAVAAINKETGLRFLKAVEIFRRDGYTVKLWDAYRPLSASHQLWASCPDPRYVIKPEDPPPTSGFRPRHNNGMCVDITLVDSNGNELEMPTGFDDFTEKAAPDYPHVSEAARRNRDYLISVMESAGFQVARTEWWHFTDITGTPGPYLDVPLEAFS